jgi:hypothetical protein
VTATATRRHELAPGTEIEIGIDPECIIPLTD